MSDLMSSLLVDGCGWCYNCSHYEGISDTADLYVIFYRKRISLLREATTKPWKAGDRIKKYTVIPNRTEKANTRGLDREIYHLLRKFQAKIH